MKWSDLAKELKQGRRFISYMGLRILGQGLLFLIPVLLALILNPADFGIYSLGMMLVYFFIAFTVKSSNMAFLIYGAEEFKKTGSVRSSVSARLKWTALLLLPFLLLADLFYKYLMAFTGLSLSQWLMLFVAFSGLFLTDFLSRFLLVIQQKLRSAMVFVIMGTLLMFYLAAVYLFLGDFPLQHAFIMFGVAGAISTLLSLRRTDLQKMLPLQYSRATYSKLVDFSRWMIIGSITAYLIRWGDNFILRYFVSFEQIGVYNLAYQFFKGVWLVTGMIRSYFLPDLGHPEENPKKVHRFYYHKRPRLLLVGAGMLLIFYFALPPLLDWAYGNRFTDVGQVAKVLLMGTFFVYYNLFNGLLMSAYKRYKFLSVSLLSTASLNLLLDYWLVQQYGIVGAAYATVASVVIMALVFELAFRSQIRKQLLPVA